MITNRRGQRQTNSRGNLVGMIRRTLQSIPWEVQDAPQFIAESEYTGSLEVMGPEQLSVKTLS